jgi:uncharacterized protein YecE (DUF72 family)
MTKSKIWIGTSGWAYRDWSGRFYPEDLTKKKWLEYYSSKFNAVELNVTFYRQFSPETFAGWYNQTPDNFRFVVKLSRYITHVKRLSRVSQAIKLAEKNASALQEKLGLILLQLPASMPYKPERLYNALAAFADPSRVAVEFRHKRWFTPEVHAILTKFNTVFCNVDSPGIRIYDHVTAKTAYLRLHGHTKMYNYYYNAAMLKKIAGVIKKLLNKGVTEVYIFFNNDFYAYAPANAKKLSSLF